MRTATAILHPKLRDLWLRLGGNAQSLQRLRIFDSLPEIPSVLPSSYCLDAFAVGLIGLSTLATSEIAFHRGFAFNKNISGSYGDVEVSIDRIHACLEFNSEKFIQFVNGDPIPEVWDNLAGLYSCRGDDEFIRIHTNFPHHRKGIVELLGCESDDSRGKVAEAIQLWDRFELEEEISRRGLVAMAVRTYDEWMKHPQVEQFHSPSFLPVKITKIPQDSPAARTDQSWLLRANSLTSNNFHRPLEGIRVLDITRIIAGPVAGRTLAAHGADVLHISATHLPSIDSLQLDTGRGKRTTSLDLRSSKDKEVFIQLVKEADVVIQGYRPGGIADLGFDKETLHRLRPGLIIADLCTYGFERNGPWNRRRGFDSLTQAAMGFNTDEMIAFGEAKPKAFPAQCLDHGAGYLLALGVQIALLQSLLGNEGSGWHIEVSLAGTGQLLRSLGRQPICPISEDSRLLLHTAANEKKGRWIGSMGEIIGLEHSGQIKGFPPSWNEGAHKLGDHPPCW